MVWLHGLLMEPPPIYSTPGNMVIIGVLAAIVTALGAIVIRLLQNRSERRSRETIDPTQLVVTHVTAQNDYAEDLRQDIKDFRAEITLLKHQVMEASEKWFAAQTEILANRTVLAEKQIQLDKIKSAAESLSLKVKELEEIGAQTSRNCEEKLAALEARCIALEAERDHWHQRYEDLLHHIGAPEVKGERK